MILKQGDWLYKKEHYADVVVVGSGAAGTALATECATFGLSVIVLEGGERDYSETSQDCYSGESEGISLPYGLKNSRLRFYGGSTNCWAGGCGVLNKEDFIKRKWIQYSGWPIKESDLSSFYESSANFLDINLKDILHPENVEGVKNIDGFATSGLVYTKKVRFKTVFNNKYKNSSKISLYLGANLFKLNRKDFDGSLKSVTVKTFDGRLVEINGKAYVLACGGVENARTLLNSKTDTLSSIGNLHDNVGRYFMDHPIAPCATVINEDGKLKDFFYSISTKNKSINKKNSVIPYYRLPFSIQSEYSTLNTAFQFRSSEKELTAADVSAWKIKNILIDGSDRNISFNDISNIVKNPLRVINSYKDKKLDRGRVAMRFQIEQAPNKNNRIELIQETDAVGVNRVKLTWGFSEIERHSIDVATAYAASILHKHEVGSLRLDTQLYEDKKNLPLDLRGGQHHSGTTRMSNTKKSGVVDKNLLVHDSKNLFVLGSSVFPTNGWVNPTFTIISLAMRLAKHLDLFCNEKKSIKFRKVQGL